MFPSRRRTPSPNDKARVVLLLHREPAKGTNYIISDSKGALYLISTSHIIPKISTCVMKCGVYMFLILAKDGDIRLMRVPSHSVVIGNDIAGELVGSARKWPPSRLDWHQIHNPLLQSCFHEWLSTPESWTQSGTIPPRTWTSSPVYYSSEPKSVLSTCKHHLTPNPEYPPHPRQNWRIQTHPIKEMRMQCGAESADLFHLTCPQSIIMRQEIAESMSDYDLNFSRDIYAILTTADEELLSSMCDSCRRSTIHIWRMRAEIAALCLASRFFNQARVDSYSRAVPGKSESDAEPLHGRHSVVTHGRTGFRSFTSRKFTNQ